MNVLASVLQTDVYLLPEELDEKAATLHFLALGEVLTVLAPKHTDYTGLKVECPFRPTGSVDHDTGLKSTADFDSSQTECSSPLAPNVTVGAQRFRYAEVLSQAGHQSNMKCVVYIRKELCTMSSCHVARPCSK